MRSNAGPVAASTVIDMTNEVRFKITEHTVLTERTERTAITEQAVTAERTELSSSVCEGKRGVSRRYLSIIPLNWRPDRQFSVKCLISPSI